MKIVYLFDLKVEVDSRAQKEIAAFVRHGHQVIVHEWNKDENHPAQVRDLSVRGETVPCISVGIKVKKNKGFRSNIFKLLKFEFQLFLWLLKNNKSYDLIYCVNLDTAYAGHVAAKIIRKPYVYDVFDDYADAHRCGKKLNRAIKRTDYRVMRSAEKVILCSEKRKEQIINPLQNCEIIYNVPDVNIPETESSNECFTIVYVGNLTENRMIEDLLAIAAAHPEWRLECGGDGTLKELVQQYAGEYENISYHGILAYEDVIRLEQTADVIPALYDPEVPNNVFAAPNKVFEAMSLGKPTIMVRNTGMDNLVEQIKSGLVIEKDRKSLEQALESIHANLPYWKAEKPGIQHLFEEKYSWEKMEKKLMEVIPSEAAYST